MWNDEILQRMRYSGDDESNFIAGSQYGDWMDGRDGNDALHGMDGNDSMRGGRGDDFMDGGSGNDILLGQDGQDQLMGGDGDDVLNGGAGDDILFGGMGNTVFQVDLHGGIDTIYTWYQQGAHNTLQFGEGIAPGDVLVRIDPNSGDLVVSFNASQDRVTVVGYLDKYSGNPEGLNELRFANGVSWSTADIRRESTNGNDGDNVIDGTSGDDTMDGKGGNDRLMGLGGDDVLLGGDGDDLLEGGTGNNTLNGGRGNDYLGGDVGADTYVFNIGDGQDYINEYSWGWGWQVGDDYVRLPNTIRFGAGIAPTDLQFVQNGDTLYIYYGSQDSIAIPYTDTYGAVDKLPVDRFEFADNSVWTYRELINHAPELMVPVGEVWAMEGQVLEFQIPSFTFFDRDPEVLRYQLALAEGGDLPAWLHFDQLTGKITGTPGYSDSGELDLKVTALDNVGATASDIFKLKVTPFDPAPELRQEIATQNATEASPFSITIAPGTFVDPDGGPVSYQLTMASGAPLPAWLQCDGATLSGIAGDADTGVVQLRLTATDGGGNAAFADYALNVANINQAPVLVQAPASQSVEDGVAFSYALPGNMFGDADAGDSGVLALDGLPAGFSFDAQTRTISGTASLAEVGAHALTVSFTDAGGLRASAGFALTVTAAASVSLTGSAGADTLTGKSNSDVLRGLGGDDILNGAIGADRMEGGSGNDTFYVDNTGDLVVENSADGTDTVMASINYTLGANVERLTLTGNAINATGNTLNNTIAGNSGNNLIDGGLGDDSMAGGAGNDTYMVGSTSDAVTEALDAGFDRVISSVGRSLGANQETLTLTGTAAINGNGNLLNNLVQGNSGINSLTGGDGNDVLQGGAGDDTLNDSSFATGNLFDGGLGADRLTGGAGADMFIGGAGNDIINTSSGADVIAFNRGSGMDAVVVANGNDNTVSLGHGILYSDLSLAKSGNDLILKTGMGEQIAFNSWYSSTNAHSVGTLQVVTEGGADYVVGSASAIHDNKIEQFNFNALVAQFDQVRVGQGSSFSWNVAPSLEAFSSGGSDSAAIGGDLAYQYAQRDTLSALSAMPALAIIGSPSFGVGSQALQAGAALNDGIAVLY